MKHPNDPETLKIPAYMRNKAIVTQARQKLILTALDRKEAGLLANSKRALAPVKNPVADRLNKKSGINRLNKISSTPRVSPSTNSFSSQNTTQNSSVPANLPSKLKEAGTVTHYLEKIAVAIIKLTTPLKNGDHIYIQAEGHLFLQEVAEMQIDRKNVAKAKTGSHIGMKVSQKALLNSKIYKV
ncbi:hypothetical protein IT413_00965 [Candidatus Peregrinibacteria bacterium]|nr:hypothetical protein [Candidatus Peregrinibacteria bacterium]